MTSYFGPAAGRKSHETQAPTPVGRACGYCEEAITLGQAGTLQAYTTSPQLGKLVHEERPVHYECSLRSVIGSVAHIEGTCSCHVPGSQEGDPPGMSRRVGALMAALSWELKQRD